MILDAFDLPRCCRRICSLLFLSAHAADILSPYEIDMVISLALARLCGLFTHETGTLQQKHLFWSRIIKKKFDYSKNRNNRKIYTNIFAILSAVLLLKHHFSSVFSLSGRRNNSGVWRSGAACCSACSTYHRPLMAMCRARPRRGLVAGCVWGSNDVPTWLPWTSTVIQTPTLKRKERSCIKQHHISHIQAVCTFLTTQLSTQIQCFMIHVWKKKSLLFPCFLSLASWI